MPRRLVGVIGGGCLLALLLIGAGLRLARPSPVRESEFPPAASPMPARQGLAAVPAGAAAQPELSRPRPAVPASSSSPLPPLLERARAESAVRLVVPSGKQARTLSCEFQSATDLAAYYGAEFAWHELFEIVGYDPTGNPHKGFAGRSIDDPPGGLYPDGYGVYAEPVARGLRSLGLAAHAHSGKDARWLRARLAAGHPVVVWATARMQEVPRTGWTTTDGVAVEAVPWEHTYTVVGYDDAGVWVIDPYNALTHFYEWADFERAWALLDNMALTIEEPLRPVPAP